MKRKSKLMSLLLSLVLMFSLFTGITSANAEDDTDNAESTVVETVDENSDDEAADAVNDDTDVIATEEKDVVINAGETTTNVITSTVQTTDTSASDEVQALIDALPTVDELSTLSTDELNDVYTNLQDAYEAYEALSSDEQALVNDSKFDELFNYFNSLTTATASDELTDESLKWSTLTNPAEDETGDVTLTVVTTEDETETYHYANIMDAVKKLFSYMNHGDNYQTTTSFSAENTWYNPNGRGYNWSGVDYTWDYKSAVISFTGEHCEYITTSVQFKSSTSGWQYASLNNVTFDGNGTGSIVGDPDQSWAGAPVVSGGTYGNAYGYGSYSNLKGTITISGNNCTIKNTKFEGNHTWAFTYYTQDNAIGVGSDVTGLTIENNTFSGYTLVTAFGQSGGTVTDEVFTGNTVSNCLFLFHTADGGAKDLVVTNNTLTGSAKYTLASSMAYTTVKEFSGNTLSYASFGLQNCETDMEQFLNSNTYDHGYIYQETVDYSWTDEKLGNGTYYYLPSSTTVMTILPDDVAYAVWLSDYNEAGSMDSALTYTQQDAINGAVDAIKVKSNSNNLSKLTWTGGGRDDDGNLLDGGVAIGYNYNSTHLNYIYKGTLTINKEITGEDVDGIDTSGISFVITDDSITDDSDNIVATVPYSEFTDGSYSLKLVPGTYTVTEVTTPIDNYTFTTTVENEENNSISVDIVENEKTTVNFTNTYTALVDITVSKVWDDNNSADRPTSVDVTLYAGNDEVETITLSEENGWTYIFEDLPKYADNEEIKYTVSEEAIDGYTTSISGSVADGFVITNTLNETEPTTSTDPTTPTTPSDPEGSTPSETTTPTTSTETTPSTSTTKTSANDATTETVETNVKTGDSANIALYALVLIIAMFGIVTIRRTYKKKQ